MSPTDLILFVLIAGGAFYAGYQVGRFKALAELGGTRPSGGDQPLPGPRLDGPSSEAPPRPRAAPPLDQAAACGCWPHGYGRG